MDALPFSNMRKFILCGPRSGFSSEYTHWGLIYVLQEEEGGWNKIFCCKEGRLGFCTSPVWKWRFVNLCGRCTESGSLADSQTLAVPYRYNLYIFLSTTIQKFMECWYMQSNWSTDPRRHAEQSHCLISQLFWLMMNWGRICKFICWIYHYQMGKMAGTSFSSTGLGSYEKRCWTYTQPQILLIPAVTPLSLITDVSFTCMREWYSPC